MPEIQAPVQPLDYIADNPVLFDRSVTTPIIEGFNIALASFQALYIQYQKHHFVVEGAEFYSLHEFFAESYGQVQEYVHKIGERMNGLGGIPVASFAKLAELCCFTPEADGGFTSRQMVENDLDAEKAIISLLRKQAAQAESLGDRATRLMYENMLMETEDRAFHLAHFLTHDSLTLAYVASRN